MCISTHKQNNDGNEVASAGCTSDSIGFLDSKGQTAPHWILMHSMDQPPLSPRPKKASN